MQNINSTTPSFSPIIYKPITFSYYCDSKTYYDIYSNKIIIITPVNLQIYDKTGEKQKKIIRLKIKSEYIQSIVVDKTLMFMLLFVISHTKESMVYVIDINNSCIIECLKADFSLLMGMFFIEDHQRSKLIKKQQKNTPDGDDLLNDVNSDNVPFCLIFMNKIIFFKIHIAIQSSSEMTRYTLKQTNIVRFSSGGMIDFYYSPTNMILCCEKNEESFAFFNLSNDIYYSKNYIVKLSLEKKEKIRKETSGKQSKIEKKRNYKTAQFFLEVIYSKLYFICLNLYEGKIVIYQLKDLNTLEINCQIMISAKHATLQFIDNMIILHDFTKEESTIYDLKMKNKEKNYLYYKPFPMTNYHLYQRIQMIDKMHLSSRIVFGECKDEMDYNVRVVINYSPIAEKELGDKVMINEESNDGGLVNDYAHNTFIYNKEIVVNGAVLEEIRDISKDSYKNTMVYHVYFDPEVFYQSSNNLDHIFYLLRRKNTNPIILKILIDIITKGNRILIIKQIFSYIINRLWKQHRKSEQTTQLQSQSQSQAQSLSQVKLEAFQLPNISNSDDSTNTLITQCDIYSLLINNFEHNPETCPIFILTLLIHFTKGLLLFNIPLEETVKGAMLSFIKKIKNPSKIMTFFQYKSILDSKDLAMYLIDKSTVDIIMSKEFFQMGIDMLIRLKQNEDVIIILLKRNMVRELLLFIDKKKLEINDKIIEMMKDNMQITSKNKRMIHQYIIDV